GRGVGEDRVLGHTMMPRHLRKDGHHLRCFCVRHPAPPPKSGSTCPPAALASASSAASLRAYSIGLKASAFLTRERSRGGVSVSRVSRYRLRCGTLFQAPVSAFTRVRCHLSSERAFCEANCARSAGVARSTNLR